MIRRKGITGVALLVIILIVTIMAAIAFMGCSIPPLGDIELYSGRVLSKIYEPAESRVELVPNDDPWRPDDLRPEVVYDDEDYKLRIGVGYDHDYARI